MREQPDVDGVQDARERAGVREAHEDRGEGELGDAFKEGNREVVREAHEEREEREVREVREVRDRSDGSVERD